MKLEIIACDRVVLSAEAEYVSLRTPVGWLGILPGHAPASFSLREAPLVIRTRDGERTFRVGDGFVEVSPHGVTVLADAVEEGGDAE